MDSKKTREHKKGFTIVEIVTVIAIIGILAAITVVSYAAITNDAKSQSAMNDAQGAGSLLNKYRSAHGRYPANLSDLTEQPADSSDYQYTYKQQEDSFCLVATAKDVSVYIKSGDSSAKEGDCSEYLAAKGPVITNIVTNPSAEIDTTGAMGYYGSPVTRVVGGAASGGGFTRTVSNSTSVPQGLIQNVSMEAKPNQAYTCSVSMKGTAGHSVLFSARPAKEGDVYLVEGLAGKMVPLSTTWQRTSISFITPPGTKILRIQQRIVATASGITLDSDALMCVEGPTDYPYADGSTAGWSWAGTPHASPSSGPALN